VSTVAACPGHLHRQAVFTCVRCGTYGCADCAFFPSMVEPRCKHCVSDMLSEPLAWERRQELGVFRALWLTTKQVLRTPREAYRTPSILAPGDITQPLLFAGLATGVGMTATYTAIALGMVVMTLGASLLGNSSPGAGSSEMIATATIACCYPLAGVVLGGPMGAMTALLGACFHWIGLRIVGVKAPFSSTLRAEAYSAAIWMWGLLPVVGLYVGLGQKLYVEVVAIRETHGLTTGKAITAIWAPRLVLGCVFFSAILAFAAAIGAFANLAKP
jgi:hypothetical protein